MDLIREDLNIGPVLRKKMRNMAAKKLQESYRSTWAHKGVSVTLARSSHLMIWSDNDVTNDFTVARNPDGSQEFDPDYLKVAMDVYRMYQRQLWDPKCGEDQEWHFHQYGPFGIFLMDMRGNRINQEGTI